MIRHSTGKNFPESFAWGEMLRKGFIVSRSSIINRSLGGLNEVNSMFLAFSSEIYQETDLNTYQQNFFQTKAS